MRPVIFPVLCVNVGVGLLTPGHLYMFARLSCAAGVREPDRVLPAQGLQRVAVAPSGGPDPGGVLSKVPPPRPAITDSGLFQAENLLQQVQDHFQGLTATLDLRNILSPELTSGVCVCVCLPPGLLDLA